METERRKRRGRVRGAEFGSDVITANASVNKEKVKSLLLPLRQDYPMICGFVEWRKFLREPRCNFCLFWGLYDHRIKSIKQDK